MSNEMKRKLTLDEGIILAMPYAGFVGITEIKAKLGELIGLDGERLDTYSSMLEKSVSNNETVGYLWKVNHPLNSEPLGYALSTKGLQLKDTLKKEVGEGRLLIGTVLKK